MAKFFNACVRMVKDIAPQNLFHNLSTVFVEGIFVSILF